MVEQQPQQEYERDPEFNEAFQEVNRLLQLNLKKAQETTSPAERKAAVEMIQEAAEMIDVLGTIEDHINETRKQGLPDPNWRESLGEYATDYEAWDEGAKEAESRGGEAAAEKVRYRQRIAGKYHQSLRPKK